MEPPTLNMPPVFLGELEDLLITLNSTSEGTVYELQLPAIGDPEGEATTLVLVDPPSFVELKGSKLLIYPTSEGNSTVTLEISDGVNKVEKSIKIIVTVETPEK